MDTFFTRMYGVATAMPVVDVSSIYFPDDLVTRVINGLLKRYVSHHMFSYVASTREGEDFILALIGTLDENKTAVVRLIENNWGFARFVDSQSLTFGSTSSKGSAPFSTYNSQTYADLLCLLMCMNNEPSRGDIINNNTVLENITSALSDGIVTICSERVSRYIQMMVNTSDGESVVRFPVGIIGHSDVLHVSVPLKMTMDTISTDALFTFPMLDSLDDICGILNGYVNSDAMYFESNLLVDMPTVFLNFAISSAGILQFINFLTMDGQIDLLVKYFTGKLSDKHKMMCSRGMVGKMLDKLLPGNPNTELMNIDHEIRSTQKLFRLIGTNSPVVDVERRENESDDAMRSRLNMRIAKKQRERAHILGEFENRQLNRLRIPGGGADMSPFVQYSDVILELCWICTSVASSRVNCGGPCVSTKCGHVFHHACLQDVVNSTSAAFPGQTHCPICHANLDGSVLTSSALDNLPSGFEENPKIDVNDDANLSSISTLYASSSSDDDDE